VRTGESLLREYAGRTALLSETLPTSPTPIDQAAIFSLKHGREDAGMTTSGVEESRGRFRRGRAKTGGRRKGTPNRATRAAKVFLAALCDDEQVQDAVKARILKGDTSAFFKAVEIVHGKARQTVEQGLTGPIEIRWKDDLAARIEGGRRRVAEARSGSKDD
jgi:hypothetical protein